MPNAHQQDCIVIFVDMAAPLAVTSTSQEKVNDFAFLFLKRNIIWHILITVIQIIWHISISEDNIVTFARIKTEKKLSGNLMYFGYFYWHFQNIIFTDIILTLVHSDIMTLQMSFLLIHLLCRKLMYIEMGNVVIVIAGALSTIFLMK